jgi:predicted NBD/HSP70 family sugar kinase
MRGANTYLAIDIGATKTLLAVFSEDGKVLTEKKIATSSDYTQFIQELKKVIDTDLNQQQFSVCCCAVPGTIDFKNGVALAFGNEDWRDVPIKHDIEQLLPESKVLLHNDAKLAALSEATLLGGNYSKVLYLTISTGVGGGVIRNGKIDPDFENFEPGQMVFEFNGQRQLWEDFASGRALKARYGKLASEIEDPAVWQEYTKSLTNGFENIVAIIKPDVIVIGGGVGAHFEKFKKFLDEELSKINNPLVPIPPIIKAKRPEEAVIYGCYEFIKQNV